jgi:hypothetical protein
MRLGVGCSKDDRFPRGASDHKSLANRVVHEQLLAADLAGYDLAAARLRVAAELIGGDATSPQLIGGNFTRSDTQIFASQEGGEGKRKLVPQGNAQRHEKDGIDDPAFAGGHGMTLPE